MVSQREGKMWLCVAGSLISLFIVGGIFSQKLHRLQETNLQDLIDAEEMTQDPVTGF
jgi:hypothetical protein